MKISVWDILTGLTLLGVLCLVAFFGAILLNPSVSFNPLQPPATVPTISIPTATITPTGLPPTWTPIPSATTAGEVPGIMPTLRPSRTPEPTATRVVLPTFTPSKTLRVSGSGQGGGNCSVVYQNPTDDSVMTPSSTFSMRWTLKNNSSESWRADSVDLRFMSGQKMHSGADVRDMAYDVGAGGAIDILVDMMAPAEEGQYTSNWALLSGSSPVCRFYITIKVDR
jgi:hypothetical protein